MKKILIPILFLSLILFVSQNFSLAQKTGFHVNPGAAFPQENNIKSGFESGFGMSFPLMKRVVLSLDFSYWKSTVEEEAGKLFNGKLSVTPFFLSFQFNLMEKGRIIPYVFLGPNLVFSTFEIGEYYSIPELTINQEIHNGVGFHVGGGGDILLTDNWALFGSLTYLFRKTNGETRYTDMNLGVRTEEFSVSLNSFILKVGIKYFLD
jgi:opacity protein-like surface antigen